jgi:glycosyltransferase involved in cell wall biosynthesis
MPDKYEPLVSVAITCYNSSKFIETCIRSVLAQTYKRYEIILIDDCSTDSTLKVIEKLGVTYKLQNNVKVFTHSINCGYGLSLKHAIEYGTGDLIVIVDSDDALANTRAFEVLVEQHREHPEVSLVYSDYWNCSEDLLPRQHVRCRNLRKGETYLGKFIGDKYVGTDIIISHVKCFKRSFYNLTEGLDGSLLKAVDKDLVLKLEEVGKILYLPMPLYYHRRHNESISDSFKRKSKEYKDSVKAAKVEMYQKARERRQLKKKDHENSI